MGAWVAREAVLGRIRWPRDAPDVSLVGGAVRDALLGVPHGPDLDLVVEGDAAPLARRLGRELGGRVVEHGRFGTARLELPHGRHLDLVGARQERYPEPGALPEVEPGTIADDLARRDFTVNAIAYRLTGPRRGTLLDPSGGRADLRAGLIRIMRHDAFVEDPSRLLRAVRYEARLGFRLDPATRDAGAAAASRVDPSSPRVGDELRRLLEEEGAAAAAGLARAAGLGVPWLPAGAAADDLARRFAAIDDALARPGAPADLDAWALRMGEALGAQVAERVWTKGWARGLATEAAAWPLAAAALTRAGGVPSRVDEVMRAIRPATAVTALAHGAEDVAVWWERLRGVEPLIGGADLVAEGVRPGPVIGRALRAVRAALLDGEVGPDRGAQIALALRVVADT